MWNKLLSILKKGQGSHPFPKKGQQITLYLLSAAPSWKVIGRYVCSRALQTAVWVHDPMKMPNGTASWTTLSMPCWAPVSTHHGLCSAWEPGFPLALALGSPGMKPKASRVWRLQRCYWNGNDLQHCWNTEAGCHLLLQGIFPTQGSNLNLLLLLQCRQILYCWATGEAPVKNYRSLFKVLFITKVSGFKKTHNHSFYYPPLFSLYFCIIQAFLEFGPHVLLWL